MAMKKASGYWEMDLWLRCPYCGDYVDCEIEGCEMGDSYSGKVTCSKCGKTFIADIRRC